MITVARAALAGLFTLALGSLAGCPSGQPGAPTTQPQKATTTASSVSQETPSGNKELLVVSYDAGREVWDNLTAAYAAKYKTETGQTITFKTSYAGSRKQTNAVIDGLKADVAGLALPADVDLLASKGLVQGEWRKRYANNSAAYTSTLVYLTRAGNPKGINNWTDLIKPGVEVITPSPITGGGSKLNFLVLWAYQLDQGKSEAEAQSFTQKVYAQVPVLDEGARGSANTFLQKGIGDVFITWEAEGTRALSKTKQETGKDNLVLIRPAYTLIARPPVVVVDKVVDEKGTRAAAEAFVKYAFSPEGQEVIAKSGWRPTDATVAARYSEKFPPAGKGVYDEDIFGPWKDIDARFFSKDGVFNKIYQPKQ